jgi:acylglycerol lipase
MRHNEGWFKGLMGFNIYYQCWLPESKTKSVLLIAHGATEHSGRYMNIANFYAPRGYAVYALDHRGHGRSDGERLQINDFHDYVIDLKTFFNIVSVNNPDEKIFLLGHSMGSIISLAYVLEYQDELAGLIISGGGLSRPGSLSIMPKSGQPLSPAILSRDPAVIAEYINDPLVFHGPLPEKPTERVLISNLPKQVQQIKLPVLLMAGNGGSDGTRSQYLYEIIGSTDKTLRLYEGLLHEIFNDPGRLRALTDLEEWLKIHN